MIDLPEIPRVRLEGTERFKQSFSSTGLQVLDFWQWSASALGANNLRGHLAEFLVASDIGIADGTRREWDEYDLLTPDGVRIEVKSASYIQQWRQRSHSKIEFNIAPGRGWDSKAGRRAEKPERNSDVYVFCLIETLDQSKFDPKDLDQWVFFCVATSQLNEKCRDQKKLSLARLRRLEHVRCRFGDIAASVQRAIESTITT